MSKFHRSIERSVDAERRVHERRLLRERIRCEERALNAELTARVNLAQIEEELDREQYAGIARQV